MTPQLQNATPGEKTTIGQPLGMSDLATYFTLVESFQPHSHLYFDAHDYHRNGVKHRDLTIGIHLF